MRIDEVGLLTNDVVRLADFYKWLLGVENGSNDTVHQFILTEGTTLTIGHTGLVQNNSNPSMCLAFTVNDVDKEYLRLKEKGVCILEEPKTRLWGVRNMSFCDPDGNLLYFRSFLVDPY